MTVRTDVTLDWDSSPRLLTVLAPSVEITIQDLVDTLRNYEDSTDGIGQDKLVDAAGKEFLGGTTYVGITATLQNCIVAFEARVGPSWTLCIVSGGNLVAVDSVGAPIDPRSPTAYVSVDRTASSSATALEVDAGSGLSTEEHDQLMSLPDLTEIEDSNVIAKQNQLLRTLGLSQENYYLDQAVYTTYNGQKLLTSARIRTYNSPVHVGTGSGVLATYLVTSNWTDDELTNYKVTLQTTTTTTI